MFVLLKIFLLFIVIKYLFIRLTIRYKTIKVKSKYSTKVNEFEYYYIVDDRGRTYDVMKFDKMRFLLDQLIIIFLFDHEDVWEILFEDREYVIIYYGFESIFTNYKIIAIMHTIISILYRYEYMYLYQVLYIFL